LYLPTVTVLFEVAQLPPAFGVVEARETCAGSTISITQRVLERNFLMDKIIKTANRKNQENFHASSQFT